MTRMFNVFRWQSRYTAAVLITLLPFQMATAGCALQAEADAAQDDSASTYQLGELVKQHSLAHLGKRALRLSSVDEAKTGSLTLVQRFDSALRLNPHLRVLMLDGVYVDGEFFSLPAPSEDELIKMASDLSRKVLAHLGEEEELLEPHDDSVMPYLAAASAQGKIALGPGQGHGQMRLVEHEPKGPIPKPRIEVLGFCVFADSRIAAHDKRARYRLCRYLSRPPVATQRLRRYRHQLAPRQRALDDGKWMYKLKRRFADGTEAVVFEPLDLISRLCALVPPVRFHLLRYHGVLAAHAKDRRDVVPAPQQDADKRAQLDFWDNDPAEPSKKRIPWAKLLARVFKVDVTVCPSCGGPTAIVALCRLTALDRDARLCPPLAHAWIVPVGL